VTSSTHDEGFHEIQLNGKQLVFLFMAASVVAGVIFLLGVFVGRGVRVERGTTAQAAALSEAPVPDVVRIPSMPIESAPTTSDPTAATPPAGVDDLSYFDRLDKDSKSREPLEKSTTKTTPTDASVLTPASAPPTVPAGPQAVADSGSTVPSASGAPGDGYAVQVAALNIRSEADAVAKRLTSKGYAAYVQVPSSGGEVFRVRVGTFRTRRDAETVAARLQKEERITPWVTR
jgi:cell division septation protein DedD